MLGTRATPHVKTGPSPFKVMTGTSMPLSLLCDCDVPISSPQWGMIKHQEWLQELQAGCQQMKNQAYHLWKSPVPDTGKGPENGQKMITKRFLKSGP